MPVRQQIWTYALYYISLYYEFLSLTLMCYKYYNKKDLWWKTQNLWILAYEGNRHEVDEKAYQMQPPGDCPRTEG